VVATRNGVVIPRTTRDLAQRAYLEERGLVDLVTVPVFQGGVIVGTLAAHNRLGDVSSFDDEDAKVFATLAHHVGTAIENARLIERLRTEVSQKEYQSLHDTLTGLGNRDLFVARTDDALRASRTGGWSVAVMLMDLNRFKDVNDTLGHHHGDLLLQQVARRIGTVLPEPGMIARLGGDEFVVLLPQIRSQEQAEQIAIGIQVALQQPFVVDRMQLAVTAAIGIAVAPAHGTEVSALLQHADIAMYNAKENGDGGVEVYDPDHNRHSTRRLTLAAELQTAIADGDLEVHYQPKAVLETGALVGVEALVRWQHPTHGPIPPDEFVPLAEGSGQMRAMTTLVLDRVLQQIGAWRDAGVDLAVSVNLSVRSLIDLDFAGQLDALCRTRGVDPSALVLEITETQMMADPTRTIRMLERLAALGIEISVDDFGTGYSSLSYLQRLPVHEIKVDKSFVLGMTADDANTKIVRSIVDLGHNLGLRVVAEGVEDRITWDALAALGCDIAQGYYLSRPLPGPQLTSWLLTQTRTAAEVAS
jgi:diguanylate cyclase (GGDEF)-like protein